ncbi:MAG: cardiolipin synthase [Sphaerochaetaceae bacterium]
MKKFVKFIMSRLFLSIVLIVLQLILVFTLYNRVINDAFWAQLMTYLSVALVLWVIYHKQEPEYIIGWIVLIMIFPLYGGVFYILVGKKPLSFIGRKRTRVFLENYKKGLFNVPAYPLAATIALKDYDKDLSRQSRYISNVSYSPVWANTEVSYYSTGEDFLKGFLKELKRAKKFIFIEFFVLAKGEMWSQVLEILLEKVEEGVKIKILYDDFGSFGRIPGNYDKILQSKGIESKAFNAIKPHLNVRMNYRDHRKICVIDGNVGFTGGLNLADEYINRSIRFGHWKDTAIMLKGEAVWNLTTMFLSMWNFETGATENITKYKPSAKYLTDGFVQPFGDNPLDEIAVAETAYLQIINMAKKYVWITTPYLIINRAMLSALCIAAQSGVDVRIVCPMIPDKRQVHEVSRSYYANLIEAGVKVYEYAPGFIHSKMFVSDGKVAIIGTINMDYRSFYLHFECGVVLYGSSVIANIKQDIESTLQVSKRISLKEAKNIQLWRKIMRMILRLFSPLL